MSSRTYYSDVSLKVSKKITKSFKGSAMYMRLSYDNDVIQGAYDFNDVPVKGKVFADLLVFEGLWNLSEQNSLRFEAQALFTDQHLQDWVAVIAEYTMSTHWFISALNQYNYGNAEGRRYHFPVVAAGYITGSTRFSASVGRQRAGVFCVGGICRVVPAANGFTLSMTTSF